jgi:hypothetical protein
MPNAFYDIFAENKNASTDMLAFFWVYIFKAIIEQLLL